LISFNRRDRGGIVIAVAQIGLGIGFFHQTDLLALEVALVDFGQGCGGAFGKGKFGFEGAISFSIVEIDDGVTVRDDGPSKRFRPWTIRRCRIKLAMRRLLLKRLSHHVRLEGALFTKPRR
jgi:hypothetical protein